MMWVTRSFSNSQKTDSFEYWVTEQLKLNGVYWGLAAMDVMKSLPEMNKEKIIEFILSCQHANGGFGGNVGHDPHLLYTLSAVQVLCMLESLDKLEVGKVANYVGGLQRADGSFQGDEWGEIDTRFSYCAVSCLALLDAFNRSKSKQDLVYLNSKIDRKKASEFVLQCKNFDGGFGCIPGAESHGAYIFCCVGALKILEGETLGMKESEIDRLAWWLSERQLPQGGLNGRPEKLPDVCYSWWVVSTLGMINRIHWIDTKKLEKFILECQDEDNGGIADRPGDVADVFHTFFGVAGLSLVGYNHPNNANVLNKIDPCYALCKSTLATIGL